MATRLHAIGSFREHADHKFLIFHPPPLHDWFRIRVDNRPDIIRNILFLSSLVMKGYPERGKWIKDVSYVDLWPACYTDMKIRKVKLDKLPDELKDTFAGRWHGAVRTLVDSVHDEVDWTFKLIRECDHSFQTFHQNSFTRLSLASVVV